LLETQSRLVTEVLPPRSRVGRRVRRKFYVALAGFLFAMIVVGFWPSYYGPLVRGAAKAPLILHIHGVIFIGWMLLLIAQTVFAARGDLRTHRALGTFGIGYGTVVWLMGLLVSFVAPVINVQSGRWTVPEAAAFFPIPFGDMVLFGGYFLAAVRTRARPELHKRYMVMATIAVAFAAAFRLQALGVAIPLAIVIWYVPLALCIIHDYRSTRRVHPIYLTGAVVMAIALLRLPFGTSAVWQGIGVPLFESLVR
jgi:hypothetical protein